MLDRLIGLETEYATIVRAPADQVEPPSRREVYDAICDEISKRVPTARGRYDADAIFLANGGAFSMETLPTRTNLPGGLIEGATAEARSPMALMQCQRAQDHLIAEAARCCDIPGKITVVKNSSDTHGHVYGCQENYSAPVARGLTLLLYWFGMGLVMIPALVYWIACIGLLSFEMAILVVFRQVRRWFNNAFSHNSIIDSEASLYDPLPPNMLAFTAVVLRVVSFPVAGALYVVARMLAFRVQRKYLSTFLISRIVLTGAGHIDRCNRFRLSSKAMAIDTVTGFGGYFGERPIFVFHHWLQQLCGRSLLSSRSITELFRKQQRLQIGLSDSNISDTAEYLKVATTSLVLDMIEAGHGRNLPRLLRPIQSLHRIASDWNLITRVPTTRGEMSGLDIQRVYFRACRQFVHENPQPDGAEVYLVLRRWEETLDFLGAFRARATEVRPSLGHIDWLTKKWMLDRLDEHTDACMISPVESGEIASDTLNAEVTLEPDATVAKLRTKSATKRWASRKKVDIRYHELSDEGYFSKLRCIAPEVCSIQESAIQQAVRLPPAGSPASRRGHLIREFADGQQIVEVDWSHVVIGSGKERRVVSTS